MGKNRRRPAGFTGRDLLTIDKIDEKYIVRCYIGRVIKESFFDANNEATSDCLSRLISQSYKKKHVIIVTPRIVAGVWPPFIPSTIRKDIIVRSLD